MRDKIIEAVKKNKLIVIVRGVYDVQILKLAEALYAGGIRMMEITFDQNNKDNWSRTTEAIHLLSEAMSGKLYIGAGTVTSVELTELAAKAGARFIISPDCRPDVIRRTLELDMVSMPGCLTSTEITTAHMAGADFVKIFPAAQLGPGYIKAIRSPLNNIDFLAVGGVNEKNAADFMKAGCVGLGVGGNLVNKEWINHDEWDKITSLSQEFIKAVNEA